MAKVAMTAGAANADITKSGTVEGHVFDAKSVIFAFDGTDYAVVKKADVVGKSVDATGYTFNANASDVIKVAILNGIAGAEAPSYAFVKWDYIDNANYAYEVFFVADDGSEVTFFSNFDDGGAPAQATEDAAGTTPWAVAPTLYDLTVNSTDGIASVTPKAHPAATDVVAFVPAAATTCKKQGDVYVLTDGATTVTLKSDVTVLVLSSGKWAVKSVANLKGLDNTNIVDAYDLSSTPDAVYEVVFVQ